MEGLVTAPFCLIVISTGARASTTFFKAMATNLSSLSPAAQAVLDAARFEVNAECHAPWIAAAVLRAVADQVVPDERIPSGDSAYHLMAWTKSLDQYYQRQQTRDELLAIAAELEGQS
jgi:hypothetical protein